MMPNHNDILYNMIKNCFDKTSYSKNKSEKHKWLIVKCIVFRTTYSWMTIQENKGILAQKKSGNAIISGHFGIKVVAFESYK